MNVYTFLFITMHGTKCQNGVMNAGEDGSRRKEWFAYLIRTVLGFHSRVLCLASSLPHLPLESWSLDHPSLRFSISSPVSFCFHSSHWFLSLFLYLLSLNFIKSFSAFVLWISNSLGKLFYTLAYQGCIFSFSCLLRNLAS